MCVCVYISLRLQHKRINQQQKAANDLYEYLPPLRSAYLPPQLITHIRCHIVTVKQKSQDYL